MVEVEKGDLGRREVLQPLDHFCGPPLDQLRHLDVLLVLRAPEVDAVLQDTVGLLGCELTLWAHVQVFVRQDPQVLFRRAALDHIIPQSVLKPRIALTQDPALGLVEPHEVHRGPLLQLAQVPLDDIPSFLHVNCTTQLGVDCKLAEGTLDLAVNVVDENIEQHWSQYGPLRGTTFTVPGALPCPAAAKLLGSEVLPSQLLPAKLSMGRENTSGEERFVWLRLGSVCVHFTLGAPQQLPKAPTQKYPPSRGFIRHGTRGVIQKTWLLRKGGPSHAHLLRCSRYRAPLFAPQQCIPSPKPKNDGEMRGQVLRCKSCSCSQQRAGLICAMGARV
ncbi:LOW QUALITY PROTEIN: hypothetical protein QYF61_006888, partial [Mycteria americana]